MKRSKMVSSLLKWEGKEFTGKGGALQAPELLSGQHLVSSYLACEARWHKVSKGELAANGYLDKGS